MLNRWWMLLCVGFAFNLCMSLAQAKTRPTGAPSASDARAAASSSAIRELMATPLATDPGLNMHWPGVLDELGWHAEARALRRQLLTMWIEQALDVAPGPGLTLAEGVTAGQTISADRLAQAGHRSWSQALNRHLRVHRPTRDVPLPDEIESLSPDLSPVLPGLWTHHQHDGQLRGLFMLVGVQNVGPHSTALGEFDLQPDPTVPGVALNWHCRLPRGIAPSLLLSGLSRNWLCRSQGPVGWPAGQSLAVAVQRVEAGADGSSATLSGAPTGWRVEAHDMVTVAGQDRLVQWLAQPQLAQAFLSRHATCEQRANCPEQVKAEKATRALNLAQKAADDARKRQDEARTEVWLERLQLLGMAVGAFVAYAMVARWVSNGVAAFVLWAASMVWAVTAIRALWRMNWADSWGGILVVPLTVVLAALPFALTVVAHSGYVLLVDAEARARFSRRFWSAMVLLLVFLVFKLVAQLLGVAE